MSTESTTPEANFALSSIFMLILIGSFTEKVYQTHWFIKAMTTPGIKDINQEDGAQRSRQQNRIDIIRSIVHRNKWTNVSRLNAGQILNRLTEKVKIDEQICHFLLSYVKVAVGPNLSTKRNPKQIITTECAKTAIFQLIWPLDISKLVERELV